MDYNFWDDRTHELEINPCKGCGDYQNGKCISDGGCAETEDDDGDWDALEDEIITGNHPFLEPWDI